MGGKEWEAAEGTEWLGNVCPRKGFKLGDLKFTGLVFSLYVAVNMHPNTSTVGGCFGLPHCQI